MSQATSDLSPSDAKAFWAQLETFSERALTSLDLPPQGSPHGGAAFKPQGNGLPAAPTGAIIHWTASDSATSAVRWFCDASSEVSAHVVLADRKLPWADELADDLPLVQALPVTAIQCRKPNQTAWHARNLDNTCYGIENQNVGMLQGRDNALCWQSGTRLAPYRSDKPAVFVFGRPYEPYTQAQIQANVDILAWLNALYPGTLDAAQILGHENVQSGQMRVAPGEKPEEKFDPGPHFPIAAVRQAALATTAQGRVLPDFGEGASVALAWRAKIARVAINVWNEANTERRNSRRSAPPANPSAMEDSAAWGAFYRVAQHGQTLVANPLYWRAAAACLNFDCWSDASDGAIDSSLIAVQRLAGLAQDGVFGPLTAQALATRFRLRLG